jgi:hypothetical protein
VSNPSQIPQAIARAHAELLTHTDLQFDFPKFEPPKTPDWLIQFLKFLGSFGPYPKYVFWAAVIIGALLLAFFIGREILRRILAFEKKTDVSTGLPEWRPSPKAARLLLQDADALAAQGRFTEAVHLLLLRSIQDIEERNPNLLKPALTSREIGALDQLPGAVRPAFAYMARVVESALFGNRDAGASDFAQCREAYERFAFPSLWAAA